MRVQRCASDIDITMMTLGSYARGVRIRHYRGDGAQCSGCVHLDETSMHPPRSYSLHIFFLFTIPFPASLLSPTSLRISFREVLIIVLP